MLISALLGLTMFASKPVAMPTRGAKWVSIGKAEKGVVIQADASTMQKSGDQRAVWLRVINPVEDARGIKQSTFLVWLNCTTRAYNLMVFRDDDDQGKPLAQNSYGDTGKGFEAAKSGTGIARALTAVCR